MEDHRYPAWKQLLVFALAGPILGSLVLFIGFGTRGPSFADFLIQLAFWLQMTLPAAYFVGLIPALAAGGAAALVRAKWPGPSRRSRAVRFFVPVLVGAMASAGLPRLLLAAELAPSLAAAGAVAAVICTGWAEWRSSVRPNNSFKPKPLRGSD
jgi:putative effector of murein hydrolase LrgA (UPF0299 family)